MPKVKTGTVIYRAERKTWRAVMSVSLPEGGRKRRSFDAPTREEAIAKMRAAFPDANPLVRRNQPKRDRGPRIIESVLRRAQAKRWTVEYTAQVLLASMAGRRVELGIVGPCVYCGDEMARTVDHVVPTSVGGTDSPGNVVSCCITCNRRKNKTPLAEWKRRFRDKAAE